MKTINRKGSAVSLALGLLVVSLCVSAQAQQPKKIPRIGYLVTNTSFTEAFLQGLRDLGYFEGKI